MKSGKLDSQIADSDMILLSIGGNDLLTLHTIRDDEKLSALKNIQAAYLDNLREILNIVKEKNPGVLIAFTGLYNPEEGGPSSILYGMAISTWNSSIDKLIQEYERVFFVETQDVIKSNLTGYISLDKLHPSSAGYQAVSEKVVQLIMGLNNK